MSTQQTHAEISDFDRASREARADDAHVPTRTPLLLPAASLWWREVVRFYRQRSRWVGVVLSPVLFWAVIGSGLGDSFRAGGGEGQAGYLEYFFPGTLVLTLLFTSIFCMMSVIEDRREGFLLSVLVSPAPRASIVLGKVAGGTTLAVAQGTLFLLLAPLAGLRLSLSNVVAALGAMFLVSFGLTALGFCVAWRLDSTHGFHALVNLLLVPMWLLSGALFPASGASLWVSWVMRLNPLTYGVALVRHALGVGAATGWPVALGVVAASCAGVFLLALVVVNRRGRA